MTTDEHPEWAAFMSAIIANPDDDTVRLVAADYLEENGNPDRAAFIRIQVQLARIEADGEGKSLEADHFRAKERAFLSPLSMYPMLWAAEECPELVRMPDRGGGRDPLEAVTVEGADRLRWHRGFLFAVRCSAEEWRSHARAILARQPIMELSLTKCITVTTPEWLAMVPTLTGLKKLGIGNTDVQRLEWLRQQLPGVRVGPLAR